MHLVRAIRQGGRQLLCVITLCWTGAVSAADLSWFDGGLLGLPALQALALLRDADSHGLNPQDYGVDAIASAIDAVIHRPGTDPEQERLSQAMTTAMERYLNDPHIGRIDSRQIYQKYRMPQRNGFDAGAELQRALVAGRLEDAVRHAVPQVSQYERLREALAQYRGWTDHPAWQQPLPALPLAHQGRSRKLEPGQPWTGLEPLSRRLALLGDLPPAGPMPARYDGVLVEAVQAFQRRHGLTVDGVIGRTTLAQLEVKPEARARQIRLNLERLRWTPVLQARRMVVINVPEFVLRAYEVQDGRIRLRQSMKVIVGKALDTRTPLIDVDMRYIEFSPYWNVPSSIAREETVPRLRRDPGYFDREGFEFVTPGGQVETSLSAARLDAVTAGAMRIRQRPGPRNALGDIKFVFPNSENIFLHHTPSVSLFDRERRDFSHGCIRLERPVDLASFVMEGMPGWSEPAIVEAMDLGTSSTVRLAEPVPVLIAYGTALFKDGRMHFFEDIYGHDRLLEAALWLRPVAPSRPVRN
jgi:murein L,D-transpeptidase YcbB/YkuD